MTDVADNSHPLPAASREDAPEIGEGPHELTAAESVALVPPTATDEERPEIDEPAAFTVMLVGSVTFELPSASPVVTLIEQDVPYRQLEIPVGLPEAQALAQAIYGVEGVRPGTHELFAAALRATATEIVAVRITRLEFGIYYAELDLITSRGQVILDCRPTDALILALRQGVNAPILCGVEVFES